jgi:hypothetical protein
MNLFLAPAVGGSQIDQSVVRGAGSVVEKTPTAAAAPSGGGGGGAPGVMANQLNSMGGGGGAAPKVSKQAALAPLSQWLVANLDLPGLSLSPRFPHFTSCSRQSRALRLSPGRGWGAEREYLQSGAAGGSAD